MKWFARGKLWDSPEEASEALRAERFGEGGERRGAGWRPGGEHEDPRAKFKVPRAVKRARFVERMNRDDDAPTPTSGMATTRRRQRSVRRARAAAAE